MVVVRYGMSDMKGILNSAKKKDYLYHVISLVEETLLMTKKDPKRYGRSPNIPIQSTIIFDMDQFSMRHITYKPGTVIYFSWNWTYLLDPKEIDRYHHCKTCAVGTSVGQAE